MNNIDIEFGNKIKGIEYIDREAVYGLLFKGNKIAIIKTPRGFFLPGGGVEHCESFEDCLIREIIEETGLVTKAETYIGKSVLYDKSPKDNKYYNMYGEFYIVSLIGKRKKLEADHTLVYMCSLEAIKKLQLVHQKWAIKKAVEIIKSNK